VVQNFGAVPSYYEVSSKCDFPAPQVLGEEHSSGSNPHTPPPGGESGLWIQNHFKELMLASWLETHRDFHLQVDRTLPRS